MGQLVMSTSCALMVMKVGSPSPFVVTVLFARTNIVSVFFSMAGTKMLGRR